MNSGPITILIIDDHRLIRESWTQLINTQTKLKVVGAAGTAAEGIEIATRLRPQIVLMDINLGADNGFDTTAEIRKKSPSSKIIAISMHAIPAYVKKIFQAGARGYITKNSSMAELVKAIHEVLAGNKYTCDEIKDIITEQRFFQPNQLPDINTLSKREIEVVKLVKQGLSSKQIADQLAISIKTVEVHRYAILRKLNIKNTASLVNFVNEIGL